MTTLEEAFPRPVVILCLVILSMHAVLVSQLVAREPAPHEVTVGVSAPPIIAQALTERANALPGRPLTASPLADPEQARATVHHGTNAAAVAVDLAGPSDRLYVSSAGDPELNDAVEVRVRALSASYGRGLEVVTVPPASNPAVSRAVPYALTTAWIVIGFALAAGMSLLRGPLPRSWRAGAERAAGLALAAAAIALPVAVMAMPLDDVHLAGLWAVGTGVMVASAWTTLACESLAGLAGLGVATLIYLLLAPPMAALRDLRLMPEPWTTVTPMTLHGAGLEIIGRLVHFGTDGLLKPTLVVAAWIGLPLLTMVVARRERLREQPA
jgi:hypothetical protein